MGDNHQFSWLKMALILGGVIVFLWLFYMMLKKFSHFPLIEKIKNVVKGIWSGLNSIRYIKNRWLFILYSALIWTLYLMSSRIGFYAMHEVSNLGMREAFSILSFGSLGMIATQGGLGAYQYIVQEILVLYGQTQLVGFTFGWILWIAQTAVILIGGLICSILLPIVNRKRHESNTTYSAENS